MAGEIDRYRREYCITDGFLAELDKIAGAGQENKAAVQERRISYVLKTGANWAGPIKVFRLAVDGGKGRLVSFCHAGLNPASGSTSERAVEVTARARTFSALMYSTVDVTEEKIACTCPPMRSVSAGAAPR